MVSLCWVLSFSLFCAFSFTLPFLHLLSWLSSLTPTLSYVRSLLLRACSYSSPLSHAPSLFLVPLLFPTPLPFLEPTLSCTFALTLCIAQVLLFLCSLFVVALCLATCLSQVLFLMTLLSLSLSLWLSNTLSFSVSLTHTAFLML